VTSIVYIILRRGRVCMYY